MRELAALFLRLGVTAFGGPAAHVAMMEDEVVRRREWMTRAEFLDLVGACNLIPGPNSTELAIHIGHRRAGWRGLIVAGCCFIVPAVLIVTAIAWAYVRYGQLPHVSAIVRGIKPVIIAIVAQAIAVLARNAVKSVGLATLGLVAIVATALGVHELAVLFVAGALVLVARWPRKASAVGWLPLGLGPLGSAVVGTSATTAAPFGLGPLFLLFVKIGSVLFGSGYVLVAFLRTDLVERLHWLTSAQLLDAVAVGQITPGPVFTAATFVGYLLGGWRAAGAATLGIFLPAFVFVALSAPLLPRLRASRHASAFLDGVNVASLSLMVVASFVLGCEAVTGAPTAAIAVVSAILLIAFRVNTSWLVLAGGIVGYLTLGRSLPL